MNVVFENEYVNVYWGLYYLSNVVMVKYEEVCGIVWWFFNVRSEDEVIFILGVMDGINLVVNGLVLDICEGDEIVFLIMEYYFNIVLWYFFWECNGVVLKWIDIESDGLFLIERF